VDEFGKKIKRLSQICGAPIWLVKESLGIPLETLPNASFEDLKMVCIDADEDSEEQYVALEQIRLMFLIDLKSSSLSRAKEIYELALELDLGDVKIEASQRWNDLSLDEVKRAKDYEQLDLASERAHPNSSAKRAALEKRAQWAERDFLKAHTLESMSQACRNAPQRSEIKKEIIKEIYIRYF